MNKLKLGLPSLILVVMLMSDNRVYAQQTIPLYNGAIPNSKPTPNTERSETNKDGVLIVSGVSRPTLTVYLPPKEKATGAAIVICPGGGYSILAAGHEGADVAKDLAKRGIAGIVLKYRLPSDASMVNKEIGPLQDAQRALQVVRQRAEEWNINPGKIGLMGFSAGGHLAATAGTQFSKETVPNEEGISLRPDFLVLVYPVISFSDSVGHTGSRDNLLGKAASPEKVREYSAELQVNPSSPPSFLVHAKDDWVKPQNSELFAAALRQWGIPVQLHMYEKGGHGYGMYNKESGVRWMDLLQTWLGQIGFL